MIRPVELFLALRYLRPRRSHVSIITILSLLSVTLSVMVLIIVLSVMSGFEKKLRDKIVGFNAHVTVTNRGVMNGHKELRAEILKDSRVEAASPFVYGPVLSECGGIISTPFIKGVDAEESEKVIPIRSHLIAGDLFAGPEEVVVGAEWAARNNAAVGDRVLIHAPKNLAIFLQHQREGKDPARQAKDYTLPTEYRVCGIFQTGMFDYDANVMLIDLSEAQRLYAMEDAVHGIAIRLKNLDDAPAVQKDFNHWLRPPAIALTWMDQNRALFSAIAVEKVAMSFCLLFIMLVAVFGICSTLITVTVQRAKEIGLMKAIGARNGQVAAVFTLYGMITGVVGSALGVIAALVILAYRNEARDWLASTLHISLLPPSVYNLSQIPAQIDPWFVVGVAAVGVLLSTLAALLPAVLAATADPVKSLRGD